MNRKIMNLIGSLALGLASFSNAQELKIIEANSPNYTPGRKANIEKIIIHSTEGNGNSGLNWLRNPKSKASSHYLIMEDGETYSLVNDTNTAWHVAGANSFTLGIELAGYANKPGFSFTDNQYTNVAVLVNDLLIKHSLSRDAIISHSNIEKKYNINHHTDPDPNFDWNRFYCILDGLNKEQKDKRDKREYELDVTVVEVASTDEKEIKSN